jgi:hypothetical protein
MRRTSSRRCAVLSVWVAMLVLVLGTSQLAFGSPPTSSGTSQHPSGKDRTVEPGGSGTQGKAPSDPDGDANGGPDKPGLAGGVDTTDQDGNNGCGNDQDFEDDNNGLCGPHANVGGTDQGDDEEDEEEDEGEVGGTSGTDVQATTGTTGSTSVLGTRFTRSAPPAGDDADVLGLALTRTGPVDLALIAFLGLGAVLFGSIVRRHPVRRL